MRGVMGVYAVRNTLTGRVYVGSSVNIGERVRIHLTASWAGSHPVGSDIEELGLDVFDVELLERIADEDTLGEREDWWMRLFLEQGCALYNKSLHAKSTRYSHAARMVMREKAIEYWRRKTAAMTAKERAA